MQTNKTHPPSIIILILLVISALFLLLISMILATSSVSNFFGGSGDSSGEMISAVSFCFEAFLIVICGWFVLNKVRGKESADQPFSFPYSGWQIFAILGVVFLAIIIGGIIASSKIQWLGWISLPLLTLFVIAPPVWLLIGIGGQGINFGPRWRVFGAFAISMTISPFLIIIIELVLLAAFIVVWGIAIGLQPGLLQQMTGLVAQLKNITDQQILLQYLAPYLQNPFVIASILAYIAVLVPLTEEALKPVALWLFAKKIESPAQGFVLGMISGAGFGLIESLNASADGTTSWPFIVTVRAGTSLLHMTTSGLVGWGIVSAVRERRFGRLIGAYAAAVGIHGLWNASAAGIGIASIGEMINKPEWLIAYIPAFLSGMAVLGIGIFAILVVSNRKLRIRAPIVETENIEAGVK